MHIMLWWRLQTWKVDTFTCILHEMADWPRLSLVHGIFTCQPHMSIGASENEIGDLYGVALALASERPQDICSTWCSTKARSFTSSDLLGPRPLTLVPCRMAKQ